MKHDHHTMKPTVSVPEIAAVTILSFVLLGAGVWLGAAKGNFEMSTVNMRDQMSFDRLYIDMMTPHHQAAVAMAELALQRSEKPEIRELAQNVIQSQNEEIGQMKRWRKTWFGSDRTPSMAQMPMIMEGMATMGTTATMDMQAEIEILKTSKVPFDKAFIDAMIPHHGSAVQASRQAEALAVRPEILQLAKGIIGAQEKEIADMRRWRSEWLPGAVNF